ncbi:hypothetical protein [Streptosporangium sp. NPDC006013]|uniref:hypothetical protein n=1 Tax=unclassified Streptosporangium TaxID=2632669 RepID=UPI0033A5CC79
MARFEDSALTPGRFRPDERIPMRRTKPRRLAPLGATVLLAALLGGAFTDPAVADDASYRRGYQLGLEAYRYGLPLVTTEKTLQPDQHRGVWQFSFRAQ